MMSDYEITRISIEIIVVFINVVFLLFRIGLHSDKKQMDKQDREKKKRRIAFFLYKLTNLTDKGNWECAEEILRISEEPEKSSHWLEYETRLIP